MPMPLPNDLESMSLAQIAQAAHEQKLPPVESWTPTREGDSEMRIARDGSWFHQGSPIRREAMVRLFSTILRREADGGYVLVTPIEKLTIEVEDAPFIAVEMKAEGSGRDSRLAFRLNTGDLVVADAEHPIRFVETDGGTHPYLHVRGGLEALIARPVYYELAERILGEGSEPAGIWSAGTFFPVDPAA